jgi:hypothetical protein
MIFFNNSYQSYAPFGTSNLLNFWFPDDSLWTKSWIDASCGMLVYLGQVRWRFINNSYQSYAPFVLKNLLNGFQMMTYEHSQIKARCGLVCDLTWTCYF